MSRLERVLNFFGIALKYDPRPGRSRDEYHAGRVACTLMVLLPFVFTYNPATNDVRISKLSLPAMCAQPLVLQHRLPRLRPDAFVHQPRARKTGRESPASPPRARFVLFLSLSDSVPALVPARSAHPLAPPSRMDQSLCGLGADCLLNRQLGRRLGPEYWKLSPIKTHNSSNNKEIHDLSLFRNFNTQFLYLSCINLWIWISNEKHCPPLRDRSHAIFVARLSVERLDRAADCPRARRFAARQAQVRSRCSVRSIAC